MMKFNIQDQNKLLKTAIIFVFIFFALGSFYGGNYIYDEELEKNQRQVNAQLDSSQKIIDFVFQNFRRDITFLNNLAAMQRYVGSQFNSSKDKMDLQDIFARFLKDNRLYHQIQIMNRSGDELVFIGIRDNRVLVAPEPKLSNMRGNKFFVKGTSLNKGQIFISPLELSEDHHAAQSVSIPVIHFIKGIFDANGEKLGVIRYTVNFSELLRLLPSKVFVQAPNGGILLRNNNGNISLQQKGYPFIKDAGEFIVSDTESIVYRSFKTLGMNKIILGVSNHQPFLKVALKILLVASLMLLVFFIGLMIIVEKTNLHRFKQMVAAQKAIISSLGNLVEWRDPETGQHLERTRNYAAVIAKHLRKDKKYQEKITDQFLEDLYDAAPLHDIGKVGVADAILLKESGLTQDEYNEMKRHVSIGKGVLQDVIDTFGIDQSFFVVGRNICAYHHERYDGKGYLEGLKGDEIPVEARIFSVCDAYDVIRSKRPYKTKQGHDVAIKKIQEESGRQFDPDVVKALVACENRFNEISHRYKE